MGERLFFDNSGGSLRLKEALDVRHDIDMLSDCTVAAFGLFGVVRVSPMHAYNENDMDTFLKATQEIVNELK